MAGGRGEREGLVRVERCEVVVEGGGLVGVSQQVCDDAVVNRVGVCKRVCSAKFVCRLCVGKKNKTKQDGHLWARHAHGSAPQLVSVCVCVFPRKGLPLL